MNPSPLAVARQTTAIHHASPETMTTISINDKVDRLFESTRSADAILIVPAQVDRKRLPELPGREK